MPLTILQFLNAIALRLGPLPDVPGLGDPLAAIIDFISANPNLPQARLLANIIIGICTDSGSFGESDTYLLEKQALALVSTLAEDWRTGRYSDEELKAAVFEICRVQQNASESTNSDSQ